MVFHKVGFSKVGLQLWFRPFVIGTTLSTFQMVYDKMLALNTDFKWSGRQISDPTRNLDFLID